MRSWVDDKTAVTVTAQQRPMVFYRDDQAGVNIYDFADLGAFEINQSGKRQQYLSLLLWSTVARPNEYQSKIEDDFSSLVIWADDQVLSFKRYTQDREMVHLGNVAFKRSTNNGRESYYEISLEQLSTLAAAKTLRISPGNQPAGDTPYRPWRDDHGNLSAFMNEVTNTNKMIAQ